MSRRINTEVLVVGGGPVGLSLAMNAFRTTATGIEMARIPIPCRAERYTATDGPDTWWPTPEPPHRINQIYLEPVLFAYAAVMPGLRILNRTRVLDFRAA